MSSGLALTIRSTRRFCMIVILFEGVDLPMLSLSQRIARGLTLIVVAVVLAAGGTLAYPHIAGLIYYKPHLDRLFGRYTRIRF